MERLLKLLEENARLSVEDLATMLNCTPQQVAEQMDEIALFVAKRLSPMDDVLSTATHFVLRTYKKDGVMYAEEEQDERELATL